MTEVKERNMVVRLAITIVIPLLLLLIPTNEIFTSQMRMAIAVTTGLLFWAAFELTDLLIPSVLWTVILLLTKTVEANVVFAPYLSLTFYGAMSMMIFAGIMARIGVLKRLAYWIAAKAGGSFGNLTFGVFFAVFAIAMLTFTGGVIIAAAFCFGICKALNLIGKKEGAIITMAGILGIGTVRMFWSYPITIGMMNTSVQTTANPDFVMNFGTLLQYNWPCFFFCLLCIYVMLLITKTKNVLILGGKEYCLSELETMGPIKREEKLGIVALLCILVFVITNPFHKLDMMYGFCFFTMLMFLPGINVGTKQDIKEFSVGTLIFVMACMSIGGVCNAVGIVDLIKGILAPMLASLGSIGALFVVLTSAMIGNLGMTPNALLAGFSGMIYTIFESIGMSPLAGLFTWNYGCDLVFLPYEYATPLLFMAFGTMSVSDFLKLNVLKNILFYVFFGAIIIPFWFFIGLI